MGCIGKREINDLAIVMAVGIDKGKEENMIKITAQVARPADARGQTGAPSGNTGDPVWSASAEGTSIFEAIRNLTSFSSRRVFWAHNYVIVINEEVAKEGISDIIDFFTRNPELRMRTWVVVTPNEASEVIATMTGLEVISGEALYKLFRYSSISAAAPRTQMLDLQAAFLSESTEPVLAKIELKERKMDNKKSEQNATVKQVELAGTGVFKGDKLVGYLTPDESRALLPFIEKLQTGVVVLPCPKDPTQPLSIELKSQTFSVKPSYEDKKPSFKVNLKTYTSIVEAGCPFTLDNEDEVNDLEKELKEKLKTELETVVKKAQEEYKADFLELGKVFNNQHPSEWNEIKENWEDVFPTAKVEINVDAMIKSSSLLYSPTKSGKSRDSK